MSAFVATGTDTESIDQAIPNDGWAPDLSTKEMQANTRLDDTYAGRIPDEIRAAMIEINMVIADWRAGQAAATLADVPARQYGGVSEKIILYKRAVYTRARSQLLSVTRDFDSTHDGHNKADALEAIAMDWMARSNEAISRLTDRPRTVVELI